MSTRYVWSKHTPTPDWGEAGLMSMNYTVAANGSNNSGQLGGYLGSDVVGDDGAYIYESPTGRCKIVNPQAIYISTQKKCTSDTQAFAVKESGNTIFFSVQNSSLVGKCFWLIQPSANGKIAVNMFMAKSDGTIDIDNQLNVGYRKFVGWDATASNRIGYAASDNSSQYPTESNTLRDGVVYAYAGSDSIDPRSISATGSVKPGSQVTVTVSPSTSKKYGGTVSYTYQYKQNSGSWTTIRTTAEASISFTVPSGMQNIQFRVQAKDDLGFTSTTYVTSSTYYADKYAVSLTVSPAGGGTATGGGSFYEGTSVTVKASPAAHYNFVGWKNGGTTVSTSVSYTFTVTENVSLTAVFQAEAKYTVSVTVSPPAGGTVSGAGSFYAGETANLTAAANDGYVFEGWMEDAATLSTSVSYSFTVNSSRNLTAKFKQKLALWVGVGGKARKGTEMWVGVNGKARKVTGAWVGVNGKARRFL